MESQVFDRIEKKYLITSEQKEIILSAVKKNMKKDKYHKSEVFNIYFDNDNYDLIIQSIEWTDFKEKIRARSYGGYDRVFLEIKTKVRGKEENVGYKRRVMITRDDYKKLAKGPKTLQELLQKKTEKDNDPQIAKEVDYLIEKFDLKPKILVVYDRESYKGENNFRITFDENLKYRTKNLGFLKKKSDKIYFKDNRNIIMEVKVQGSLPLWLVNTISELKVYPQQFSKIGNIFIKLRKEKNV